LLRTTFDFPINHIIGAHDEVADDRPRNRLIVKLA